MTNGWDWKGQDNWYIYWAPTEDMLRGKRRRLSAVATTLDAAIKSYDGFTMYGDGYKLLDDTELEIEALMDAEKDELPRPIGADFADQCS